MKTKQAIKFPKDGEFETQLRHAFLVGLARQPAKSPTTRVVFRTLCSESGITNFNKFRSM